MEVCYDGCALYFLKSAANIRSDTDKTDVCNLYMSQNRAEKTPRQSVKG